MRARAVQVEADHCPPSFAGFSSNSTGLAGAPPKASAVQMRDL